MQSVPAFVGDCWNLFSVFHPSPEIKVRTPLPFFHGSLRVFLVVDFPWGGYTLMSGTACQLSQPYPGGWFVVAEVLTELGCQLFP